MLVFLFQLDGLCLRIDSNLFPQTQVVAHHGTPQVTCDLRLSFLVARKTLTQILEKS